MYKAYVTTLKNVRPHPNADRMKLADCFGNTVCVSLDAAEGEIVVYFPVDGQLSEEFCQVHDLVRRKDENGNPAGGYLDPEKRNIRAIKLRGEKSDGLTMPLSCLVYTGVNLDDIDVGMSFDTINGHEICCKYVPKTNVRSGKVSEGNKTRKHKTPVAPLFAEHADTEQLAYNLGAFKAGDEIEITLKMHGTSQRTGYLPALKEYKHDFWGRIVNTVNPNKPMGKLARKLYEKALHYATPIYDWGYVTGTRRTVLDDFEGGYYGSNEFREQHSKAFEGKLMKGETVYYEVVGFTHTGAPIMASADNKKMNDKDFIKQYGKETVFSYGCRPLGLDINVNYFEGNIEEGIAKEYPQSDIYVYRMTMTNEDGFVVEYTPNFMRYRCEQMGVKTVPVLWKGTIPVDEEDFEIFVPSEFEMVPQVAYLTPGEWVKELAEEHYDGPDPVGKTHVREGVVVRIINRPKFCAYKHKNFAFKVLEGLIKDVAEVPDMEEAEGVATE